MSKKAALYGIGNAEAELTAVFLGGAIPGAFVLASFFHSYISLLTSLKSLFYKALRALGAVRTNLASSDLLP